jgi:hypothetical protein
MHIWAVNPNCFPSVGVRLLPHLTESYHIDKRYEPVNAVPSSLLEKTDKTFSPGFNIKGEVREGRPLYLDMQVLGNFLASMWE